MRWRSLWSRHLSKTIERVSTKVQFFCPSQALHCWGSTWKKGRNAQFYWTVIDWQRNVRETPSFEKLFDCSFEKLSMMLRFVFKNSIHKNMLFFRSKPKSQHREDWSIRFANRHNAKRTRRKHVKKILLVEHQFLDEEQAENIHECCRSQSSAVRIVRRLEINQDWSHARVIFFHFLRSWWKIPGAQEGSISLDRAEESSKEIARFLWSHDETRVSSW